MRQATGASTGARNRAHELRLDSVYQRLALRSAMAGYAQGEAGADETDQAQASGRLLGVRQVGPYSKSTLNNVDGFTPNILKVTRPVKFDAAEGGLTPNRG